jgi:hypothetical protein
MTFTTAEVFLFMCNAVTLVLYLGARSKAAFHRNMVMHIIEGIADKKIHAFRDDDGEVQLTNNVRGE